MQETKLASHLIKYYKLINRILTFLELLSAQDCKNALWRLKANDNKIIIIRTTPHEFLLKHSIFLPYIVSFAVSDDSEQKQRALTERNVG